MTPIIVLTTTADRKQAERIARSLVERRLVACAQISEIDTFFRWDGAVQHEGEFRLLLKTTEARYAEVEAAIRELHNYEVPAILSLPISQIHAPFADWIAESTL